MITKYMTLASARDIRQWASDIVESWEGDDAANVDAMATAIAENSKWGDQYEDIDWDVVVARAYKILDTKAGA